VLVLASPKACRPDLPAINLLGWSLPESRLDEVLTGIAAAGGAHDAEDETTTCKEPDETV
jgi:hypothetical protein